MPDRVKLRAEWAAAKAALAEITTRYPELPLLVAQLRQRFAADVFKVLTAYLALEARVESAGARLRELEPVRLGQVPVWTDYEDDGS